MDPVQQLLPGQVAPQVLAEQGHDPLVREPALDAAERVLAALR